MNLLSNYTQQEQKFIKLAASELLFNAMREQLQKYKDLSCDFGFHVNGEQLDLHADQNFYGAMIAFEILLTETELNDRKVMGALWESFYDIYSTYENSFTFEMVVTEEHANVNMAEKIFKDWSLILSGYRLQNINN